ncbi:MAG: zinc-binding alcohol dehydrogenase [Methylobacteriaceae bacterium]|nr:zinc-binding alcohol dehydrogenase [Methylobacteriaceae bacterium]
MPRPAADQALVRTLWSGLSRGTERLVFSGRVPVSEHMRMRAPLQEGDFPFPVKYGYCCVGTVEDGPAGWGGRTVFALHPHQDVFVLPVASLSPVPPAIPPRRAILAANQETALNGLWDSACGPGDRIVVVGAGVLGMLIGALAARLPGTEVTLIDVAEERRPLVERLGARFVRVPSADAALPRDADVVFHASATEAGLALSLELAGLEANVVEMSWYGDARPALSLGGAFHSRRLKLIASQVGEVAPSRRPRWTHPRRLAAALALLDDARLDALITQEVAFGELHQSLPRLLAPNAPGLVTAVRYPES